MRRFVRGLVIAGLVSFAVILIAAGAAHSQEWNSSIRTGLTSVSWQFENGAYVWTLTNNSSLAADDYPEFDILVWTLTPYRVQEPSSWTAPEGWTWDGKRMTLESNSGKYRTPFALGPGQSLTFTYQPDPGGKIINASGPQDMGMHFASHVGAVIPNSGTFDGIDRWEEYRAEGLGFTWHDQPGTPYPRVPVAEPSGLLAFSFGGVGMANMLLPRLRRSRQSG